MREGKLNNMHLVLLIEDDEKKALKINGFLYENGCSAVITDSLEKAAGLLERHKFDAVYIEMFMRAVTGFEVAIELRKLSADTPLIVFCGGSGSASGSVFSNKNGMFLATEEKKSFELEKYITRP